MDASLTSQLKDVVGILKKQEKGISREYGILLCVLAEPTLKSQTLVGYLRQLRDSVSLLGKEHERLVGTVLNLDWLNRDEIVIKEYQSFCLNLVSAHPYYLRACVRMLVKHFFPADQVNPKSLGSASESDPDDAAREKDSFRFQRVHVLLRALTQIVPTTVIVLMQFLEECFPYLTRSVYTHEVYTHNMLQLLQYLPDLRLKILELLVNRMLRLDVRASRREIQETDISSDEEETEENLSIFPMEGVEGGEKAQEAGQQAAPQMKHGEADRLDIMMNLTFAYIYCVCHPSGELDWEVTKMLYRELLSVFDKFVLPTHASCHTQFLLFYICSFKQLLWEGFTDYLWKKVTTPMTQGVFRIAAAGYIGSFLARATYIDAGTVKTVLDLMVTWVHNYLEERAGDSLHADLTHHGPFYAVCQAFFYVFCFRNQELIGLRKGYKWAKSLRLQHIVTSKLNPLRVCLPLVCQTFASVSRMHQLAFCDTIIERNNRYKFYVKDTVLEAFFPFDPYLLRRSGHWILPLFRKYEGKLPDKEQEEVTEEDVDNFLPVEEVEDITTKLGSSIPNSAIDIMQYGTSPGFKHG